MRDTRIQRPVIAERPDVHEQIPDSGPPQLGRERGDVVRALAPVDPRVPEPHPCPVERAAALTEPISCAANATHRAPDSTLITATTPMSFP